VSETIRFGPSIAAAPRTTAEPVQIFGIDRPAGTMVVCTFLAANRDPPFQRLDRTRRMAVR
jgi:cytochrome P450